MSIVSNFKNITSKKTKRKLVSISVDDYGNVRVASKEAIANMEKLGAKPGNRFDVYDTLETKQDLEQLFEALTSVKDLHGKPAVFTPFAMPCNLDYEKIIENSFNGFYNEDLTVTFSKLAAIDANAYDGAWELWLNGIKEGIMVPQFHGREHLNIKVFNEKLAARDKMLIESIKNRSYFRIGNSGYPTIKFPAQFNFWAFEENETFKEIIQKGLDIFEYVYGYRSTHFNPPGSQEHDVIHKYLFENGVKFLDTPIFKKEHQGFGKFKPKFYKTGMKNVYGQQFMVRNAVFEPCSERGVDWCSYTMKQIENAFFWGAPAIISTHRVNFCGHIDPNYRKRGLDELRRLLKMIVTKWPDVEFLSSTAICEILASE